MRIIKIVREGVGEKYKAGACLQMWAKALTLLILLPTREQRQKQTHHGIHSTKRHPTDTSALSELFLGRTTALQALGDRRDGDGVVFIVP